MDCEVTGSYTMSWHKNGGNQLESDNKGYRRNDRWYISRERLTIEMFTENDEAFYTCKAKREAVGWERSDNIYVTNKTIFPSKGNENEARATSMCLL